MSSLRLIIAGVALSVVFPLVAQSVETPVGSYTPVTNSAVLNPFEKDVSEHIAELLANRSAAPPASLGVSQLLDHQDIIALYEERDYRPIWLEDWQLKPIAGTLLEHLRASGEHGLCTETYLLNRIEGLVRIYDTFAWHGIALAPDNRALLDLLLSQAFLAYATHLVEGQVDPALAHVNWKARRRKADLIKLLGYAIENDRLNQVLKDLLPVHAEYRRLTDALHDYQMITAYGGWPEIPGGKTIRQGDEDVRMPILRERLVVSGDLQGEIPLEMHYDVITRQAVKDFQKRHGLVVDGVVGPKTLDALNVPASERLRQIELNLERWRWLPKNLGERHLRVNIAGFSLEIVEEGAVVMSMPVIVGTPYRKTPVFSARMTYLEFAPFWTVPPTILREDKLPKIKSDPSWLKRNHYRVLRPEGEQLAEVDPETVNWSKVDHRNFPGILRMDPGPWNPLGRVKFMFPNGFNVYLHDTNEPDLFQRDILSFSSGCIRIRRPIDLAQYLLEDQEEIDCDLILDLLESPEREVVGITAIPVHLLYWTAWVGADGTMNFRDDVYLRDLDLEIALSEPSYRTAEQLRVNAGAIKVTTVY